jgi:cardiolipin synthase (CMP-forming)
LRVLNIPNTLTIIRIIIIPVFITAIIYNRQRFALYLFIIAGITDLLDGLMARLTDQKTALGTFLDPLADKFLLVSSFILFAAYGWIPTWLAITVISRDLIVVIGWLLLFMITHNARVETIFLGKLAIALQLFALAYVLLKVNYVFLPAVPKPLLFLTAVITALSGLQYIYRGFKISNAT